MYTTLEAVSQIPGRTTTPPDRGDHHPSRQTYTPVQAGTLSDPREKEDYFEQSWSGPQRQGALVYWAGIN